VSRLRESVEIIKKHLGKLEFRGEEVWMCCGGIDSGLTWRPVLTADQLWQAIDAANGGLITQGDSSSKRKDGK